MHNYQSVLLPRQRIFGKMSENRTDLDEVLMQILLYEYTVQRLEIIYNGQSEVSEPKCLCILEMSGNGRSKKIVRNYRT